ncbi:MAG: iron-sulfur cluster assembly scaffold protein, partial [Sphingomonadales bacterium]|nr:iron-sulfur cluster assembly scaffold protein [Sphingomonadales bacterium]
MRAIETIGTLDAQGHIQLDIPQPQIASSRVRIIMLLDDEGDHLSSDQWESAVATNPVCGDLLHLYLKITSGRIAAASFKVQGCPPSIAAGSVLTE